MQFFRHLMPLLLCTLIIVSAAVAAPPIATPLSPQSKDKCPVCGMFVSKYPDWVATVTFKDSTTLFFDGAKDFFTYYHNMKKYTPAKKQADIATITVNDYYTLKQVDAKKASYVIGSDVYGPMGKELVPFEKTADAIAFHKDHSGKKIMPFKDITLATLKSME